MTIRKTISSQEIEAALEQMADAIAAAHAQTRNLVLAGIANGGIPVSQRLRATLESKHGLQTREAIVDISFHRDDIGAKPIGKEVESTQFAANPEESTIILVDDVLFSGRSVRAALSEVHALGRPRKIELATLVDRGNRRLPIAPNYTGIDFPTQPEEKVKVHVDPENPEKSHIDILSS